MEPSLQYNDKNVSVEEVKDVVKKELEGPGKLLGYRAMHRKVRQIHDLNVPRDLVHAAMHDLDPNGLEARGPVGKKKTNPKGSFTTKGPNWVHSLDGHDKLMGYQNSTFPLAVYGCIDTASRKLLWLRICQVTKSDSKVIGRWYLEYLYEARIMPSMIRLDRGTETGTMATMHVFLRRNHDDMDDPCESIICGPDIKSSKHLLICLCPFFYVSIKKKCECNWSCHIVVSASFGLETLPNLDPQFFGKGRQIIKESEESGYEIVNKRERRTPSKSLFSLFLNGSSRP